MQIEHPPVQPQKQRNDSNLPWVEKYRPKNLDDLISHTQIRETLNRFISQNNLPNLLFYGPPGTGKTSTMVACARKLYGSAASYMMIELNASDDRGINTIRNTVKTFAESHSPISCEIGFKLVILDEADAMTKDAQAALRRMMEKFSNTTRFCLICNYVSRIIAPITSRCAKFR